MDTPNQVVETAASRIEKIYLQVITNLGVKEEQPEEVKAFNLLFIKGHISAMKDLVLSQARFQPIILKPNGTLKWLNRNERRLLDKRR